MRDQAHNYEVVKTKDGFSVVPRDEKRATVYAYLDEQGFWRTTGDYEGRPGVPAFDFFDLHRKVVNTIYEDWVPTGHSEFELVPRKLYQWAKLQTSKTLNHPAHAAWLDTIAASDKNIIDIQRRFFSISPKSGDWSNVKKLLELKNPYITKDVLTYRAAAIAFFYTMNFDNTAEDWQLSYSANGKKYGALTRTLNGIPGGVPPSILYNGLQAIVLPETVHTRARMLAYTSLAISVHNDVLINNRLSVIKRSTDTDIINAIKYMWRYFPTKGANDFRCVLSIYRALSTIFDYAGSWDNIDILGLSKRSVEFHRNRELQQRLIDEEMERRWAQSQAESEKLRLKEEQEFNRLKALDIPAPKVELPQYVTFLNSFKAITEEGVNMGHCIGTYAEKALRGRTLLFHVDYKGEMASVEVSPGGYVLQSYGPEDCTNQASEYGRKVLSSWGKKLTATP
jgi:hypothetical protein